MMLHYKWPGNVRQLKNITEQMSVLSEKREIDLQTLSRYIPQDPESTQLAIIGKGGGEHSYENEREMIYKILVELKGNVSDLRRDLNGIRKQLNDARDIDTAAAYTITTSETPAITPMPAAGTRQEKIEEAEAEEISEPETLNLGNMERQMLMKALERNGGNRKKAARELGISDRTLYRRIKEYGLE